MTIKAQKDSPMKLDAIDKKIFYYLSANYRLPRNELAKLIRISPQRLNHRIIQLEKELIEPFVCLNYPALKISSYLLLYNSLSEQEIKSLSESGNIFYLLHLVGNHRYLAIVLTEDILEFSKEHTPNTIPHVFYLDGYFPDSWNGFEVLPIKEKPKETKQITLDIKDYKILAKLCEKPYISLLDLSTSLKMSRETLRKKIHHLENANIIQKYRFSVNLPKTGLLDYFVHIECKPSEVSKLKNLIQKNKYSGFLFQSTNNLFFSYICFTHDQLFEFLEQVKQEVGADTHTYQNTGNYIVDPTPKYVKERLKNLAKL